MLLWISWFVVCCVGGPLSSMNVARAETSSPHGLCLHRWGYWAATLARLVAASTFVCLCCGLHRWFSLFVFESWLVATLSVCTFDFIHYIPYWATHHDEFPTNPPNKGLTARTRLHVHLPRALRAEPPNIFFPGRKSTWYARPYCRNSRQYFETAAVIGVRS